MDFQFLTEDGGPQLWKFKRYHVSERIAVLHVSRAEKLWGCLPASNFFCLRSAHIENINRESRFYFQKHSPGDARSTEREPLTKPSPLLTERSARREHSWGFILLLFPGAVEGALPRGPGAPTRACPPTSPATQTNRGAIQWEMQGILFKPPVGKG